VSATGGNLDVAGKATGGRKLIAVVYADMAGYSRLIGLDDAGTLRRLRTLRRALIDPAIREHGGRVVQTGGDSLLVAFDSIDGAVRCAVKVQQQVPIYDGDQPADRRIRFRIGINIGDVIPHGTDLHGDGVNIAARLETQCPVGGICVSRTVRDHIHCRLGLPFEAIGPLTLKNIAQPVEAFVLRLDPGAEEQFSDDAGDPAKNTKARPRAHFPSALVTGLAVLLVCVAAATGWWLSRGPTGGPKAPEAMPIGEATQPSRPAVTQAVAPPDVGLVNAPRLSVVVLPLNNLGGNGVDDDVVGGITDDLTTYIARAPGFLVIARNSAFTYKGKPIDIRRVGEELGVRYAVEGSVREISGRLRVNVQLVSTETGAHIWADRFDVGRDGAGYGVDDIVRQIAIALKVQLTDVESTRGARERPANPDVADLLLQARALSNRGFTPQLLNQELALYERAVKLDPSSAIALAGLADVLLASIPVWTEDPTTPAKLRRAEELITQAELLRPDDTDVLWARVFLLGKQGRYAEVIPAATKAIEANPNTTGPHLWLGICLMFNGRAAEAIVEYKQAIRLNPRAQIFVRYLLIGYSLTFLGQYDEAILWFQKSLAVNFNDSALNRGNAYAAIAAAQALAGHTEEARLSAAEARRLWPTVTARAYYQFNITNPVAASQVARLRDGLRLAGIRDHADEDADFGLASDDVLHTDYEAPTPTTAPGARTIRTPDLAVLVEQRKPLVLDVSLRWGRSISGAVGLWGGGVGGGTSDEYEGRLRIKMQQLTHGDLNAPVVAVGWNAERYQGRNLALRLAALGYTNVYWYRGGREAWEVAGLTETEVDVQDW
jgi:adenylate cyclase